MQFVVESCISRCSQVMESCISRCSLQWNPVYLDVVCSGILYIQIQSGNGILYIQMQFGNGILSIQMQFGNGILYIQMQFVVESCISRCCHVMESCISRCSLQWNPVYLDVVCSGILYIQIQSGNGILYITFLELLLRISYRFLVVFRILDFF